MSDRRLVRYLTARAEAAEYADLRDRMASCVETLSVSALVWGGGMTDATGLWCPLGAGAYRAPPPFPGGWAGHRICYRCRRREAWRDAVPEYSVQF